jgi:hypothetical protein
MAAPLKALDMFLQYPLIGSSRPSSLHQHNKTGAKLQARLTGVYYANTVVFIDSKCGFGRSPRVRRVEGGSHCSGLDVQSMLRLNCFSNSHLLNINVSGQSQSGDVLRSIAQQQPG